MSVLDTWYLLFKTDAKAAKDDVAALDRQIAELAAKGKSRNDAEGKQLKELRKQRVEMTRDLKDQRKEVDGLGQSFVKTVEAAAAAGTAMFAFSALKSGVRNVTDFNSALRVTGAIMGKNSSELAAFAAAAEHAGGTQEGALGAYNSLRQFYASKGLQTADPFALLAALRKHLSQRGTPAAKAMLLQQLGVSDTGVISLAQSPDADYRDALARGRAAALSPEQQAKLRDLKMAEVEATQALNHWLGVLGAEISGPLISGLKGFSDLLQGISNVPGGATALGAVGGTLATVAGGGLLAKFFTGGAGPAAGMAARGGLLGLAATAIAGGAWYLLGKEEEMIQHYFGGGGSAGTPPPGGKLPLGLRTNNPGNLRPGGRQARYATPEEGIAALGDQLRRYGKRGWNTVSSILSRYAPPSENDTAAYVAAVSRATGFAPGQALDLNDARTLQKLSAAIIKHENGYNPYSDSQIMASINAGKLAAGARAPSFGGSGGGARTVSVKTGDINIQTQATDAGGIAAGVGSALENQLRLAVGAWDDGVAR